MECIKELLELIKMFSGVTRNKINLQKANCILYISKEELPRWH